MGAANSAARAAVDAASERIWRHFTHPDTQMFYDLAHRELGFRWFPTNEEIARHFPNARGGGTGMENGVLNAAQHLPGLLLRHQLTGDPTAAEQARFYFSGLQRLCAAARDPGFLPRGFALDGATYYVNSSVDQYTMLFLGLWRYFNSALATAVDRASIRHIWQAILARWERDEWEDRREDGVPATFGDIGTIHPARSSRLLEALLGGAVVTGDDHWRCVYREKLAEHAGARLRDNLPEADRALYVFDQNQVAWRLLYELEDDPSTKAVYRGWLTDTAAAVRDRVLVYRTFDADERRRRLAGTDWEWRHAVEPGGFVEASPESRSAFVRRLRELMPVRTYEHYLVQEPLEAAHVLLLSGDDASLQFLREHLQTALAAFPFDEVVFAGAVYYVETNYWLACEYGIV